MSETFLEQALLHRRTGASPVAGAVLMVAGGQSGSQYAGLVIREPTSLCGAHCHTTQVAGVGACILREGDSPLPPHTFKSSFKQQAVSIQTKVGAPPPWHEHGEARQVPATLCELEREVLHRQLQALVDKYRYACSTSPGPDMRSSSRGQLPM